MLVVGAQRCLWVVCDLIACLLFWIYIGFNSTVHYAFIDGWLLLKVELNDVV